MSKFQLMSALARQPLYQRLSRLIAARQNCQKSGKAKLFDRHSESIQKLVDNCMPVSSGIITGTRLDFEESSPEKLVFYFDCHHMDEHGNFGGRTKHSLIVKPSLQNGINLRITGRNKNACKKLLYVICSFSLQQQSTWQQAGAVA